MVIQIAVLIIILAIKVVSAETYENKQFQFRNDVSEAIDLIPDKMLKEFYNDGWKFEICITDKNQLAVCSYREKTIYIYKDKYYHDYTIADTVLHEFGHYLDYKHNFISDSNAFKSLFKIHVYKEISRDDNYCYTNEKELFASVFKDYILNNSSLKTKYFIYYRFIQESVITN